MQVEFVTYVNWFSMKTLLFLRGLGVSLFVCLFVSLIFFSGAEYLSGHLPLHKHFVSDFLHQS